MLQKLNRFWMGTLAVSLACSAFGGLQEREEEIKERSEAKKKADDEKKSSSRSQSAAASAFGSGTFPSSGSSSSGSFMSDFWAWLIAAPFAYQHDDPAASMHDDEDWTPENRSIFPRHETGQATVPYFRSDINFQWADGVDALDGRMEAGYKFAAFHARMTRYTDTTGFTLNVRQVYGLLRYGGWRPDFVPGTFEVNIGAGIAHHSGDIQDSDTSGAFTFGLKYYPVEWAGIEFRPAYYRWEEILIRDYDLSLSLGGRYLQARAGYRWLRDQGTVDVQSGPYAGLSLSF